MQPKKVYGLKVTDFVETGNIKIENQYTGAVIKLPYNNEPGSLEPVLETALKHLETLSVPIDAYFKDREGDYWLITDKFGTDLKTILK